MTTPLAGDFGLVSIEGGVCVLIRLGQWLNGDGFKNYEHAFTYLGDGKLIEAQPGGAQIDDLSKYDGREILWSTGLVELSQPQRDSIVEDAMKLVGTPYSFLDYLAIFLYRIHIRHPFVAKRVIKSKHMICSQLSATLCDTNGAQITEYPPYLVTPGKMTKYLAALMRAKI